MANHKSAQKRIRQTKARTERNRYYKTRIKNMTRDLNEAVAAKDISKAQEVFKQINQSFHSYVSKGILAKNTAARKISRLNASVKKLALANV